ncbi:MAG: hypothetical protein EXR79_04275 [Myxococcales bacterium]|nr:hypothetical protein [Myxococcales bacterium]
MVATRTRPARRCTATSTLGPATSWRVWWPPWRRRAVAKTRKPDPRDPLVCSCNEVPLSHICAALDRGATTLAEIFDATFAGCGPCGGSCQPHLAELLRAHAAARTTGRVASIGASGRPQS